MRCPQLAGDDHLSFFQNPQRFTRGFPVEVTQCEAVMVRRLKSDLRASAGAQAGRAFRVTNKVMTIPSVRRERRAPGPTVGGSQT